MSSKHLHEGSIPSGDALGSMEGLWVRFPRTGGPVVVRADVKHLEANRATARLAGFESLPVHVLL